MHNQSVDLNHNIADCLIRKDHLGYTEITNICTDVVSRVDWSVFDYLGIVAVSFAGFVMMVALLGLILALFFILRH